MAKIHDWSRRYWNNASGTREYDPDDISDEMPEGVMCVYVNDHGDTVDYRLADDEAEHDQKYEVRLNGELITDVEFPEDSDWFHDEEDLEEDDEQRPGELEAATFGTRAEAREFSAAYREDFLSPEQMGYVDYSEDELLEDMEYDEVQEIAADMGIKRNQSHEDLAAQIAGNDEPELTADAKATAN